MCLASNICPLLLRKIETIVRKTIAFIHSVAEIGGAERMSEALIDGLNRDDGFEPILVVPEEGPFSEHIAKKGNKVIVTALFQPEIKSPFKTIKQAIKLANLFRRANIQILHCADLVCTRSVLLASKLARIPVLCHMHFPVQEFYVDWLFRFLPKPCKFVYCSRELMNATITALSKACPNATHSVIHNGVDIERFSPRPCNNVHPKVGIVANLQERKGHIDFLDMVKSLSLQGYEVSYEVIGGDILQAPRQPLLEEYATELGIRDSVTFHGQINDVIASLGRLDILVCASHQEAFPVSILEAMAMQKAIVSTNVNGIPEAIIDGVCGILVPPHSPKSLSEGVKSYLDDEHLMTKLAKAARERVVKEFSLHAYLQKFKSIYYKELGSSK